MKASPYIMTTRGSTGAPNWTRKDRLRLRVMWREGVPCKDIARELGRTIKAIHHRADILNLPKRPRSNAAKPKPAIAVVAPPTPSPIDPAGERFAQAMAGLGYEDDPRALADVNRLPTAKRGDVTAAFCGDPTPGRGA